MPNANRTQTWFNTDLEDRYKEKGHPTLGIDDVSYKFNSHGYRCDEFKECGQINVLSLGCSWTFGTGLPADKTWPASITRKLSKALNADVKNWNLGYPGHSNDYISRTLALAVPILKPDLVIIHFTRLIRREHINPKGHFGSLFAHRDRPVREFELWTELASEASILYRFICNAKMISNVVNQYCIPWLYGATKYIEELDPFTEYMDQSRRLDFGIDKDFDNLARDNQHPGVDAVDLFTDKLLTRVIDQYGTHLNSILKSRQE